MALAVTFPGGSVVAADTRFTFGTDRPNPTVEDHGGKIRRAPDGWACASGNASVVTMALRAIEKSGIAGARETIDEAFRASLAWCSDPSKISTSCFLATKDDGLLHSFWTDGLNPLGLARPPDEHVRPEPGRFVLRVSWPPSERLDTRAATQFYEGHLARARNVHDVIRATAHALLYGYSHGRDVSGELELGLTAGAKIGHLRQPARWVANASDAAINAALGAPPVTPALPALLPAEQRLFKVSPAPAFAGSVVGSYFGLNP